MHLNALCSHIAGSGTQGCNIFKLHICMEHIVERLVGNGVRLQLSHIDSQTLHSAKHIV